MHNDSTIDRSSLGRILSLGDLYDARRDAYAGANIFNKTLPETSIKCEDHPFLQVDYEITDRISEKFHKLNINAELQLSVLAGMINLQGSGKYLKEEKASAKAGRMTLLYSITTKSERINISNLELKEIIDLNVIDYFEATHIVIGINWGANCTITSEYANQENAKKTEVDGLLKAAAEKISYAIKGEGEGNYEDKDNEYTKNFKFHSNCDIVTDEELPSTLPQAIEFVKKLPKLVGKANNGKGKPLSYILLPISSVINYFNHEKQIDLVLKQLKEESILRFVHLFEEISLVRQQLYDFYQDVQLNSFCLSDQQFQSVTKLKNNFAITETNLRSKLAETLVDVRSGKSEASKLDDLIKEFEEHEFSTIKIRDYLQSLSSLKEKIKFIDILIKKGIDYIGKSESLYNLILSNESPENYIFFWAWSHKNEQLCQDNIQHFLSLINTNNLQNSKDKFIIVDYDLQQEYAINGTVIHHYIDGQLDCKDVLKKKLAEEKSRRELEVQSQKKLAEEKLRGESHFKAFSDYDNYPKKEINILILGETGVGKSTWINGLANYFMYDSLEKAENGELISVIPSSFTMTDDDYNERVIKTGEDSNENLTAGQSSTQHPVAYTLPCGDRIIRLIDTPGIGDTRGIEQDKKNLDNILHFISNYEEIHGICILLKPNNSRLSVMFRFCIKELLTHLHRSAAQNIVFCFTNSRSTFYKPGDTLPALRILFADNPNVEIPLVKRTIYCMDNEPFRFLAAIKNGVAFSHKDRQDYAISWDRAVEETKRLFDQVQKLQPHTVKDTLSLNDARKLIVDLSAPIAKISQNIEAYIAVLEDKNKEIESFIGTKTQEDRKREIEKFIQALNEQIRKLKNEQQIIIKASAKFAYFLKHNAISAYNDALGSYLELLIREEKNKINAGGSDKTLLGLEKMKRDYDKQVKILEDAMNNKSGQQVTITPDDINKLKKQLFALEINGKELQKIMETAQAARSTVVAYQEHPIKTRNNRKLDGWASDLTNAVIEILGNNHPG